MFRRQSVPRSGRALWPRPDWLCRRAAASVLESLEQRRLLSTFNVTTTCDEFDATPRNPAGCDGQLSLREAIFAANHTPGCNTINLPAGTYKITRFDGPAGDDWCAGDFDIQNNDLQIVGAGDGKTVINGNGMDRVFHLRSEGLDVVLQDLTITGGRTCGNGGGIAAEECVNLTLIDCTVKNNLAANGGGIYLEGGNLALQNSHVDSNRAICDGGGIDDTSQFFGLGTISLDTSTVNCNVAGGSGGGMSLAGCDVVYLNSSQLNLNRAGGDGGGMVAGNAAIKLAGSFICGNSAGAEGGGLDQVGVLIMADSHVDNNSAVGNGGGILIGLPSGNVTLVQSTVDGNQATSGAGGGIYVQTPDFASKDFAFCGLISLTDSQVSGNRASFAGGGIDANGDKVKLCRSSICDNTSVCGEGGGIAAEASLSATDSQFTGNCANGDGGGFDVDGYVQLSNCVVAGNNAEDGGGFAAGDSVSVCNSTIKDNVARCNGGGFAAYGHAVTVTGSTISGNLAGGDGGGVYLNLVDGDHCGGATLVNSTLACNSACRGGGLFVEQGNVHLVALTIARNFAYQGGGVFNDNGLIDVVNTIIAQNTASTPPYSNGADVKGCFYSQGHNLIGVGDGSRGFVLNHNGDLVGSTRYKIDPKLGDLQDNGGPTFTLAPQANSPALHRGLNWVTDTDQRGAARPLKLTCDIGAFEATVE